MADESVGSVRLDFEVVGNVQRQVAGLAKQAQAQAEKSFEGAGKAAGDAIAQAVGGAKSSRVSEPFRVADDAVGLLNQKLDVTIAKLGEQQAKMRSLMAEYAALGDAKGLEIADEKIGTQITAVQDRMISLQQTALQTQVKIDKAAKDAQKTVETAAKAPQKHVKSLQSSVSKAAASAKGSVASAAKSIDATVKKTASGAQKRIKSVSGGFGELGKAIKSSFKAVFVTSVLYAAFRGIQSVISDAISTNEEFAASVNLIKSNLLVAFTPIMQSIQPALNALADGLALVTRKIAELSAALFGQTYQQALQATKQMQSLKKETDKVTGSLAGIDEINVIGKQDAAADTPDLSVLDTAEYVNTDGLFKKIQSAFSDLAKYIKSKFAPTITAWSTAFKSLKDPAIDALNRIKESTKDLWEGTLAPFGSYLVNDFAPNISNTFSTTLAPIFTDVMTFAMDEFAEHWEFICQQIENVTNDILSPAMETVKRVATDAMSAVKTEWDESGQSILNGLSEMLEGFRNTWNDIYENIIKPITDNIILKVQELWNDHLKPLWDQLVQFISSVAQFLLSLWNNVLQPIVDFVMQVFAPIFVNAFRTVSEVISTVIGAASDILAGLLRSLRGVLDFLTGVFTGDWEKAWDGVRDIFAGIWDAIWGVFKGIVNLIIDGLNGLWSGIYSVVSGIVNGIGGIAEALGDLLGQDWGFTMPAEPPLIPKLASGGLAYGPTLAMVGEYAGAQSNPEVIAPLDKLQGMTTDDARLDQIIDLLLRILAWLDGYDPTIELDGTKVSRALYPYMQRTAARKGNRIVEVV